MTPGCVVRLAADRHYTGRLIVDWRGPMRKLYYRETESFAWVHRAALILVAQPNYTPMGKASSDIREEQPERARNLATTGPEAATQPSQHHIMSSPRYQAYTNLGAASIRWAQRPAEVGANTANISATASMCVGPQVLGLAA